MKRLSWQVKLAIALALFSAVIYTIHFVFFRDVHHIFIYLVGDIAFVPIEVLLVTLIIHQLLSEREKRAKLKKLNMVIGAFFSETGSELIKRLIAFDENFENVRPDLIPRLEWQKADFARVRRELEGYDYDIKTKSSDLAGLRYFLVKHRLFLLRLLENPSLLEHDDFTDLLWAVFHLTEELANRPDMDKLPKTDLEHLSGDMKRAYVLLIREWIDYMNHLRVEYPYLYSLAVRTNPFDPDASPEVI
jgi:hypothetical protein